MSTRSAATLRKIREMAQRGTPGEKAAALNLLRKQNIPPQPEQQPRSRKPWTTPRPMQEPLPSQPPTSTQYILKMYERQRQEAFAREYARRQMRYESQQQAQETQKKNEQQKIRDDYTEMLERRLLELESNQRPRYTPPPRPTQQPPTPTEANASTFFAVIILIFILYL